MPTGVHAPIPRRQQVQHWRLVCHYLDAQPYRAVRFPYPTATEDADAPPISTKLLKRMAAFRLVRHYADCSWRLSRSWAAILKRLEAGLPPETNASPPLGVDERDERCDPFIADTGVDTAYVSLFGEGLPVALSEACAYFKELAQDEDATVETPWLCCGAPLSMYKSGVGVSGGKNHGVSWSWVLRNAQVMLLLRRSPLNGLLGSVRFSAECLWTYGYVGALDAFRADLAQLLTLFDGDIAGITFQLSQIHLCADVANFAPQPSDLPRILTRSLKKAVHVPSLAAEATRDPSDGDDYDSYDPYDPYDPSDVPGVFDDAPWMVDAMPPEWEGVSLDLFADDEPDDEPDDEEGEDDEDEPDDEDTADGDEGEAGEEEGAAVYLWGQRASGFVFSPGSELSAGWYNKELEERLSGKTWMRPIHEAGGWRKGMALTRIEPRFRRGVLRELVPLGRSDPLTVERWFNDPWIVGDHLQDLWAVFAGLPPEADTAPDVTYRGWMRLTRPAATDTNHTRWPTDPVWEVVQRARFTAIPPAALKRLPNSAPTLKRVDDQLYGLFKLRAVLRGEYLDTTATLSLELRRFHDDMEAVDATLPRDFAEEVREKARSMGKAVPKRAAGVLSSRRRRVSSQRSA